VKVITDLDIDTKEATITIDTGTKAFRMVFNLPDVAQKLETLTSNIILQRISEIIGFRVEVVKETSQNRKP